MEFAGNPGVGESPQIDALGRRLVRATIPYSPRPQFVAYHDRKTRWAVIVAHRRCGKTVATINDLLRDAITCPHPNPKAAYIAPTYTQAKDVAFGYLKQFASAIPGTTFHESELRANLPNGAIVRLYGSDTYDRMRGLYFDSVILDEYADMDPRAWSEVIRPALADRRGRATFIGTPKGRNGFAEVWDRAAIADDWYRLMLRASDTGILPQKELDDARREMSAEQYAAEFECSFQASVVGSYYGAALEQAERDERIGSVPWEPMAAVHTAWDLGIGDSTAVVMFQNVGTEIRFIDAFDGSGVGLDWYVARLRERPYTWGDHLLPHDANVRELGTGRSRLETLHSLGLGSARVLGNARVEDGINAVRTILPRCWFDARKCAGLLEAMRNYRREYDDKRKVFRDAPLHDWSSHYADAMRYAANGMNTLTSAGAWSKPLRYETRHLV